MDEGTEPETILHTNQKENQEEHADEQTPVGSPSTTLFPHEAPTEHWDIDFNDSKQSYQGTDLPIWLLAGWATFIIWAVIYLISGLPTAF